METLVKLNTQSAGRDKLARLFQYLSRALWHRLQQNNANSVNGLKNLEFQLSTFRKLLRFGKCLDVIYTTLPLLNHSDTTIRNTVILSRISSSLFLLADHLLWLGRADVCQVKTERWSAISNKYWLYSITMNLVRDFYEIYLIVKAQPDIVSKSTAKNPREVVVHSLRALIEVQRNRIVLVDTVKNVCDFFIPLTALGHTRLSPGAVGWLGVVSSIAGLMVLVDPSLKLSPS